MGRLIKKTSFFLFLVGYFPNAHSLSGIVVSITNGDTFKIPEKDSILHRVIVANIDCPECKQPFSKKAKLFTSKGMEKGYAQLV